MTVLLVAALLPAIVLLVYVYKKDKVEKEPIGLIVRLFVLGAVAGPLAAVTENIMFGLFEAVVPPGVVLLVLEYFVGVAAVEEGYKYLFLNTVRNNPEFNYVFDGIVYAVAVALGFAALENVLYVFDGGLEVAVSRAIFAVPGHCADGVVMGCFFGMAKQREVAGNKSGARTYYWLAFLLPVIEHGFYDASLSSENEALSWVALGVELVFIVIAMVLVNRISKNDAPIYATQPSYQVDQSNRSVQQPAQPFVQSPVQQPAQPFAQAPYQVDQMNRPVQQPAQPFAQASAQQQLAQPYAQPPAQPPFSQQQQQYWQPQPGQPQAGQWQHPGETPSDPEP